MSDVLFTNVRIFDGGGEAPFTGDVLVQGNRISRVVKTGYGQRSTPVLGAQTIDGAGAFRRFLNVTLPLLSPTLFFVLILNFIGAFQIFEPMLIMTNGGPANSTLSLVQHIFRTGFESFEMGYASAMAIVVLVVVMLVTLIQFGVGRYWVHYD